MEKIMGKKVRIIDNEELLSRNAISNALLVNSNAPTENPSSYAGQVGHIIGYNRGKEYGDGMYDNALYVIQLTTIDGKIITLRLEEDLVEFLD